MQKPGWTPFGDPQEHSRVVEQPPPVLVRRLPGSGNRAGTILRRHVVAMGGAAHTTVVENHARQVWQQLADRQDTAAPLPPSPFDSTQRNRRCLVEGTGTRAAQGFQVRPAAKAGPEVVRKRANVETGRALDSKA